MRRRTRQAFGLALFVCLLPAAAAKADAPVKLVSADRFGHGAGSGAGVFTFPEGVAGSPNGNVYVSDSGNHRVQKLTSTGEFVLMFGKEVNATTHGDICTEQEVKTSGVLCAVGKQGSATDALERPKAITVEPGTENVYVIDKPNWRVDEYGPEGQFLLTFGKEVNQTKDQSVGSSESEKDICTAASGDVCKAGVEASPDSKKPSEFNFGSDGDLLSVGGSVEHTIYVGDEHRIQEFKPSGEWKGEISLPTSLVAQAPQGYVTGVAADGEAIYVVYDHGDTVLQFDPVSGTQLSTSLAITPEKEGNGVQVESIALDSHGHLAVTAGEELRGVAAGENIVQVGFLYRTIEGQFLTQFYVPELLNSSGVHGISFNGNGELYAAAVTVHEIIHYVPVNVAELQTGQTQCSAGAKNGSNATFDCAVNGLVNPYSVAGTEAWFEWGTSCELGSATSAQPFGMVEKPLPVSAVLADLEPNQEVCVRLAAVDNNVKLPERLLGGSVRFKTPTVAPVIVGAPSAPFIKATSAVLRGQLNPEHSPTSYMFEYGSATALESCNSAIVEQCLGVSTSGTGQSSAYGNTSAIIEIAGLQPAMSYRYRLTASNGKGEASQCEGGQEQCEGSFTTATISPVGVQTLPASSVETAGALASGIVTANGQAVTYTFELGRYEGPYTRYAPVVTGELAASNSPVLVSTALTDLQPDATYAYRLTAVGAGGERRLGESAVFTTRTAGGLPPSPESAQIVEVPSISFPVEPKPRRCKSGYVNRGHGKCAKKAKRKHHNRHRSRRR